MTEKIKISELPEFDITELMDTDEDIAAYLAIVLEENDPAEFVRALGDVARAKGMTEIAKASGLSRESLYKALQPTSKVRFETVMRVCRAMGLRLTTQTEVDPMVKTKGAGCRVGMAPR